MSNTQKVVSIMDELDKKMITHVEDSANKAVAKLSGNKVYKGAWMSYWEIENCISQTSYLVSFSDGPAPVCWMPVDSAKLETLMNILNCTWIYVKWEDGQPANIVYIRGVSQRPTPTTPL
jgi:hypothetical protein